MLVVVCLEVCMDGEVLYDLCIVLCCLCSLLWLICGVFGVEELEYVVVEVGWFSGLICDLEVLLLVFVVEGLWDVLVVCWLVLEFGYVVVFVS